MGLFSKLHYRAAPGWRKSLGSVMESTAISIAVVVLLLVEVFCTIVNDTLDSTDLLNPKYHSHGEYWEATTYTIIVCILCLFVLEQLLRIAAFGKEFFNHWWYVMDLVVVVISLLCEVVLHVYFKKVGLIGLLILVRLWRLVAICFELFLAHHESDKMRESEKNRLMSPTFASSRLPPAYLSAQPIMPAVYTTMQPALAPVYTTMPPARPPPYMSPQPARPPGYGGPWPQSNPNLE